MVFFRKYIPVWVIPLLFIFAVGSVWLRLKIIRTSYLISQTEQGIKNLKREQEQLSYKVSSLRSPRRLELLAKTKFKLSSPKSHQVIYLKNDRRQVN